MSVDILLINLLHSVKRLKEINDRLLNLNLPYTRICAVNGSTLSQKEIIRNYSSSLNKKIYRRPLSAGEIGCYMSHKKCWQFIVENNLDMCLVIEDDAAIDKCLSHVIDLVRTYNQPWDVIKLCDPPKQKAIETSITLDENYKLCQYKKIPSRATGYLISYEGAVKLLQARKRFGRPVDDDLQYYWEFNGNVMGIEPSPIWNSESSQESDIDAGSSRKKTKTLLSSFKTPLLRLDYELNVRRHNKKRQQKF